MENAIPESQAVQGTGGSEVLSGLGWFLSGAVLPIGSFAYYRKASQKRVMSAILFFLAFTLLISLLVTVQLGLKLFPFAEQIQQAYAQGDVPEITISHGYAQVNGRQPWVFENSRTSAGDRYFLAVDTTGVITDIDTEAYDQGFLLTANELHVLNSQNDYQVLPLSEVNSAFNTDPIVINGQTVTQAWKTLSAIVVVLAFIFLALWYAGVRLMIVAMLALILWGLVSLIRPNTGFGPILITGLYAVVPAVYLSHLFSRSDLGLPGLQTFFLLVFWVVGLLASLLDAKFFSQDRPLHLWTAWIGMPMLVLFLVDLFWKIPEPYGLAGLWAVALATGLALIGVRLYLRYQDQTPAQLPVG